MTFFVQLKGTDKNIALENPILKELKKYKYSSVNKHLKLILFGEQEPWLYFPLFSSLERFHSRLIRFDCYS